ncbi:MAG: hypothetical protein JSS63_03640 [Bacteroidetes bacterium]|nr:hypothetical protein [Bacteroidota bacterium]
MKANIRNIFKNHFDGKGISIMNVDSYKENDEPGESGNILAYGRHYYIVTMKHNNELIPLRINDDQDEESIKKSFEEKLKDWNIIL